MHPAVIPPLPTPHPPPQPPPAPHPQIPPARTPACRSMETGVGLARAVVAVLQNGCHLINMSYGEGEVAAPACLGGWGSV